MKYYSEKLDKMFDTAGALEDAEAAFDELEKKKKAQELAEKAAAAEKKAKELKEKYEAIEKIEDIIQTYHAYEKKIDAEIDKLKDILKDGNTDYPLAIFIADDVIISKFENRYRDFKGFTDKEKEKLFKIL
jgi:uncharacterized protein (DUF3084 family)